MQQLFRATDDRVLRDLLQIILMTQPGEAVSKALADKPARRVEAAAQLQPTVECDRAVLKVAPAAGDRNRLRLLRHPTSESNSPLC